MQYFIGCSGFYNKDWKGSFYPGGLAQSKWFEYYSSRFNTLELNTTFYRFPRIAFLERWYSKSPRGFVFAVKVPGLITHYKQLKDSARMLNDFYTSIRDGLKEKLGPVLFQLPSRIFFNQDFLQRIIEAVDKSCTNVIEFRHVSWWNEYVYAELAKHNIIFCGASHPNLPAEIIVNASTVYYRFHGLKKIYFSQYPKKKIQEFAQELKQKASGRDVYIYFNNTATIAAINNATQLEKMLIK